MPEEQSLHAAGARRPTYLLTAADALLLGRGGSLEVGTIHGGRTRVRLATPDEARTLWPSAGRSTAPSWLREVTLSDADVVAGLDAIRRSLLRAGNDTASMALPQPAPHPSHAALLTRESVRRLCRGETITVPREHGAPYARLRLPTADDAFDLARAPIGWLHWRKAAGRRAGATQDTLLRAAAIRVELPDVMTRIEVGGALQPRTAGSDQSAAATRVPEQATGTLEGLYEALELAGRARQPGMAALIAAAALQHWSGHGPRVDPLRAGLAEVAAAPSPQAARDAASRCLGSWPAPLEQSDRVKRILAAQQPDQRGGLS